MLIRTCWCYSATEWPSPDCVLIQEVYILYNNCISKYFGYLSSKSSANSDCRAFLTVITSPLKMGSLYGILREAVTGRQKSSGEEQRERLDRRVHAAKPSNQSRAPPPSRSRKVWRWIFIYRVRTTLRPHLADQRHRPGKMIPLWKAKAVEQIRHVN